MAKSPLGSPSMPSCGAFAARADHGRASWQAFSEANRSVWQESQDQSELHGMGTTLTAMALVGGADGRDMIALANVGDSRAYVFSEGRITQVTADHSLAEERRRHGELTEAEAAVHPQRHILTRALGVSPDVEADMWELQLRAGDRIVLCSDGLSNEIGQDEMAQVLATEADPGDGGPTAGRGGQCARRSRQHHRRGGRRVGWRGRRGLRVGGQAHWATPAGTAADRDPIEPGRYPPAQPAEEARAGVRSELGSRCRPPPARCGPASARAFTQAWSRYAGRRHIGGALAPAAVEFGGDSARLGRRRWVLKRRFPRQHPGCAHRAFDRRAGAAAPTSTGTDEREPEARRRRLGIPRRITVRVILFVSPARRRSLVAAYFAIRWYAYDNWFPSVQGNNIVVIQGRAGGVLWFKPKVVDQHQG